jgi:hypothetical protein
MTQTCDDTPFPVQVGDTSVKEYPSVRRVRISRALDMTFLRTGPDRRQLAAMDESNSFTQDGADEDDEDDEDDGDDEDDEDAQRERLGPLDEKKDLRRLRPALQERRTQQQKVLAALVKDTKNLSPWIASMCAQVTDARLGDSALVIQSHFEIGPAACEVLAALKKGELVTPCNLVVLKRNKKTRPLATALANCTPTVRPRHARMRGAYRPRPSLSSLTPVACCADDGVGVGGVVCARGT